MRTLQPTKGLIAVAKAMFIDIWEARLAEARASQKCYDGRLKEIDAEIEKLLDRIVEASSPSVVGAYEKRIEKLERDKILVSEKVSQVVPPKGRFEEVIEHALVFLSIPWNIYEKGSFALKRTVLKLAFVEPLRYSRSEGHRTAEITFPFKVLAAISGQNGEMVVDAVPSELASAGISLLTRKLQGNLRVYAGMTPFELGLEAILQWLTSDFPAPDNREFSLP